MSKDQKQLSQKFHTSTCDLYGVKFGCSSSTFIKDALPDIDWKGRFVDDPDRGTMIELLGDIRKEAAAVFYQAGLASIEQINIHMFQTKPSSSLQYNYNSTIQVSNKSSSLQYHSIHVSNNPLVQKYRVTPLAWCYKTQNVVELIRAFIGFFPFSSILPTRSWLITNKSNKRLVSPQVGNVTGTLFGYKNGHVSFAVQDDGRSGPVLLLELATSTGTLAKEMSSGKLRITLECVKRSGAGQHLNLLQEPAWTMYCNGKKCGHAVARSCAESDWYLLSNIQALTADAGVIPMNRSLTGTGMDEELAYMRSRFERVVGNHNSEAYYMTSPDGTGGPKLSIYLLRI